MEYTKTNLEWWFSLRLRNVEFGKPITWQSICAAIRTIPKRNQRINVSVYVWNRKHRGSKATIVVFRGRNLWNGISWYKWLKTQASFHHNLFTYSNIIMCYKTHLVLQEQFKTHQCNCLISGKGRIYVVYIWISSHWFCDSRATKIDSYARHVILCNIQYMLACVLKSWQ